MSVDGASHVVDHRIEVYEPGNNTETPDRTVPAEDIEEFQLDQRAQDRKDSGHVVLDNSDGTYGNPDPITSGARLDVWATVDWDREYGEPAYGGGSWGGETHLWTALVRDVSYSYHSPSRSTVKFECEDFAFGVCAFRIAFNAFEDAQIAGTSDSIVDTILTNEVPEVSLSGVDEVTTTTSITMDGTNVLDVLWTLVKRADAMVRSHQDHIEFKPFDNVTRRKFDIAGTDIGVLSHEHSDSGLVNSVRVDGGEETKVDDEQTTKDGYVTVTDSSRILFRVSTRKSNIARLDLWTRKTGSGDAVTVRIQRDDGSGTAPVDVSDSSSDIANQTLESDFLDDDGLTTFSNFAEHDLPDANPWVIVESDGVTGQDIGVDTGQTSPAGDNIPRYGAYYSYDLTIRRDGAQSQRDYRTRETRVKKDNIKTLEEATDLADQHLNHFSQPDAFVNVPAITPRMRQLMVGDVIQFTDEFGREHVDASTDYVVTDKAVAISPQTTLDVSLALQRLDTV